MKLFWLKMFEGIGGWSGDGVEVGHQNPCDTEMTVEIENILKFDS